MQRRRKVPGHSRPAAFLAAPIKPSTVVGTGCANAPLVPAKSKSAAAAPIVRARDFIWFLRSCRTPLSHSTAMVPAWTSRRYSACPWSSKQLIRIPASVTSFAEGEVGKLSDKYVGGKSTQGVGFFSGPCTPPGTPHHYTFVVIATDLDPKELPAGLTREEFLAKLAPPAPAPSHAKGAAGLVGLFVKPQ